MQQAQASINKRNYERQVEAIHVAKCKYFQLDPRITSYRDIPFSVSPLTGQWYSKDWEMIATPPSHVSFLLQFWKLECYSKLSPFTGSHKASTRTTNES